MLNQIDTWLQIATADGFNAEAVKFVEEYTHLLKSRVIAMRVEDQSNGELYRNLHVEKNVIQREILNPNTARFSFPIPPAEP